MADGTEDELHEFESRNKTREEEKNDDHGKPMKEGTEEYRGEKQNVKICGWIVANGECAADKELKRRIEAIGEEGKEFEVVIQYKFLSSQCQTCEMFGHYMATCMHNSNGGRDRVPRRRNVAAKLDGKQGKNGGEPRKGKEAAKRVGNPVMKKVGGGSH